MRIAACGEIIIRVALQSQAGFVLLCQQQGLRVQAGQVVQVGQTLAVID